jgi:hypothetical protein
LNNQSHPEKKLYDEGADTNFWCSHAQTSFDRSIEFTYKVFSLMDSIVAAIHRSLPRSSKKKHMKVTVKVTMMR